MKATLSNKNNKYYMSYIRDYLDSNGGVITNTYCRENNIPTVYLTRMLNMGILEKAKRGVYYYSKYFPDSFYFFQLKYKKAIFSYDTALLFIHQTDNKPHWTHVSIPRDYKILEKDDDVIVHTKNSKFWDLGIVEVETPFGNKVKAYSYERVICDYLSNEGVVDAESFNKAIKNYQYYENQDRESLRHIAKKMNVMDKLITLMSITHE